MVQSTRYLPRTLLIGARNRVISSGYIRFQRGTSESLIIEDRLHAELLDTCFGLPNTIGCLNHEVARTTSSDSLRNMAATRGRLDERLKGHWRIETRTGYPVPSIHSLTPYGVDPSTPAYLPA
jgi:hypothetical protein